MRTFVALGLLTDWSDFAKRSPSNGRQWLKITIVFQDLQPHQSKVLLEKPRLWEHWLYLAGLRLEDGSLLVAATNHAPSTALADYARR